MGLFSINVAQIVLLRIIQVHLFGEGKVNQQRIFAKDHNVVHLPRFKWGVCVRVLQRIIRPF